ncbi:sialate O-acetylesterase [Spongiibacter marinus]|uniref:sialate O-acetylesterase n=1 Tax=Spongiibacter marinus TaxID=354246 RepID=UPI001961E7FB|nr:sialate O-acetylesterase [Spongiibacter marinus]MBM7423819.1 hypothetical protein [Spongiibacter marinus]
MEVKNYFAFTAENKPIRFCTAYLYEAGTSNLVTGLTDKNGNPIDNPFQADKDGLVQFAGPNGVYDLRFKSSLRDYRIRVSIVDTPALLAAAATAAEAGSQAVESAASAKRSEEIALDANQIYDSTADALSNGVKTVVITAPGSGGTDGQYIVPVTGTTGSGGQLLVVVSGNALAEAYVLTRGTNYTGPLSADIDTAAGTAGAEVSLTLAANRGVGQRFYIPSASATGFYDRYKVNAGPVAVLEKTLPAQDLIDDIVATINDRDDVDSLLSISDFAGLVGFLVRQNGSILSPSYNIESDDGGAGVVFADKFGFVGFEFSPTFGAVAPKFSGLDFDIESSRHVDFAVLDGFGFVLFTPSGFSAPPSDPSQPAENYEARNARNLALSAAVARSYNASTASLSAKYNHFVYYGQSLCTGFEGWPALSKTAYSDLGNLMLGNSTRPDDKFSADFTPVGVSTLQPLKAVVQSNDGSTILSDAAVAALTPGAGNEGESPDVGAINFSRRQFLDYHSLSQDGERRFVVTNCGVAGRTIAELSKGADPEIYNRTVDACTAVKSIADSESAAYQIPAIIWMQGEYDYIFDTPQATYKSDLVALRNDMIDDLCSGIAGQSRPPAFITYQTGAGYTKDDQNLAIGMAQLELSEEQDNWYLATPVYPYTDKGGHLDPNGYRWVAMQLGKVIHRVCTLRQGWRPLSPNGLTRDGRVIVIDFHVPEPPLVFDAPYVVLSATNYATKGFRVLVNNVSASILSVSLLHDTMVQIELVNDVPEGATVAVQYAPQAGHGGNGNLRDSDPTIASENYEYSAGNGQYAGANIPALVDKPYPLHNWCVAFHLAI